MKPASDRGQKVIWVLFGIALFTNMMVAPWVWPIGAIMALSAVGIVHYARQGTFLGPGLAGTVLGGVGCFFTLPPTSLHSFLVKANWLHVQNMPILSFYAVLLFGLGVATLVRGCFVSIRKKKRNDG